MEATLYDTDGSPIEGVDAMIDARTIVVQPSNRYMLKSNEFRLASDGTSLRINRMLQPDPAAQPPVDSANQEHEGEPEANLSSTESEVYWRTDVPAAPLNLSDLSFMAYLGGGANLRILCLLEPGLSEALRRDGKLIVDRGQTTVAGKSARHIEIKEPLSESQDPYPVAVTEIWIAAEGDPVLLQYKHSTLPRTMNLGRTPTEAVIVVTETFGDWQFGVDEPDATFVALPGSRRVADFGRLLQPASPLIGQPAPDEEIPLIDGTKTSLADLKAEQKIVLLDFWATWCGPCLQELPVVAKLAEEFAGDGVVLYAVNQAESPQTVAAFQQKQNFKFTAALDETGSISDAFGASSIPHLCIIGREGTVQAVHVGIGPDTEAAIRDELAALIAGRNISVDGLAD